MYKYIHMCVCVFFVQGGDEKDQLELLATQCRDWRAAEVDALHACTRHHHPSIPPSLLLLLLLLIHDT